MWNNLSLVPVSIRRGLARSPAAVLALAGVLAFPASGASAADAGAAAARSPAVVPAIAGPEIVKLDWNTRGLLAADLDGDGRKDLALINNDRSRIEILLQRPPGEIGRPPRRVATNRWEPELEDARFEKRPITTGLTVFDLAAGDLDGDGRIDFACTGDPDALTVRYQSEEGDWDDKRVFDLGKPAQFLTSLRIADLDGDNRADLLVLLQKELVVLRQDAKGVLGAPERYALADEGCYSLELADLDADGRKDVVYLAPTRRDGLRVRLQQPDATLGPEIPFRVEPARTTLQKVDRGADASPGFAYVQNQTSMLAVIALVGDAAPEGMAAALKPRVFSTRAGTKTPPGYAFGDFDGDGRIDLALADADGAQLLVYFQNAAGELGEARTFPSLSEGRALAAADWDGDGRAELFVASPKEQTLGVAGYTPAGRLSYPQPLPVSGRPLAVDTGVLAEGQKPALAVALEEGGKRRIDFLARRDGGVETAASVELAGLRTDPRAVRFVDANQDGRLDLAVFVAFEPMRLLVQDAEGRFTDISSTPGYRRGLVENLDPSALTLADVDGDGRAEMLVAGVGFARALRLDAGGTLQVADQFNAREAGTEIGAAFAADLEGDGQREVVLWDKRNEQLQVLRRNAQGVFVFVDAVPVSRIDLVAGVQLDFNRDGREDLFFLGKDRFWAMPLGVRDFRVENLVTYETDLKDVTYGDVTVGDVNGDGTSDFVMVDPRRNLVEVLARTGMEAKSVLHFRVFESDPNVQRRGQAGEPRETLIADVTGDGKNDLVLLVHDRVLVYPQE